MKIEMGRLYAVVTGDIIGSSRMASPDRKRLLGVMQGASSALRSFLRDAVPLEVDIFRGDSWQLLVARPEKALNAALYFRAFLMAKMAPKRVDTRLAIGVGSVDFVPGDRVSKGDGEAFRLSGRALETLKGYYRMTFAFPEGTDEQVSLAVKTVVCLMDALVMKWTPKQAQAVLAALEGKNQEEIGRGWPDGPISQQAVAQHLTKAGWHSLLHGISFVEKELVRIC